ncbi:MAG: DUF480 domain-containing protein [Pirellulales bacterium]|nr:DUF480 domain-containing protein [Pirellulales bacterium]
MMDEASPSPESIQSESTQPESTPPAWRLLSPIERRVVGVLAEKAKTTPDAYPLSLNAVTTGCNQKSNRAPLMQLEPEDVEEALDRLREMGAVGIVQGYGRVSKYRHYLYEWLGVDKVELAVMTELLLRGAQTEGELRARAARMEPIPGLAELRPLLDSLTAKGLILSLTPEGRGHVVSHALYTPSELTKLQAEYGAAGAKTLQASSTSSAPITSTEPASRPRTVASPSSAQASGEDESLRREVAELRAEVSQLRHDLEELVGQVHDAENHLRQLRDALGG